MDVANCSRRSTCEIVTDDPDALRRRWSATPARCSSGRTPRPRSATTPRVRTTCCRPGGAARFASALRVDDFRKHVHVVRATPEGSAALSRPAAVDRARRGSRRARPVARPAGPPVSGSASGSSPATTCRRSRGTTRPSSTCRCDSTRTRARSRRRRGSSRRGSTALADGAAAPLPGSSAHAAAEGDRRARSASPRSASSVPTGRTRCCRPCCSPTAGPVARALVFEPTYALHSHIAAHHRDRGPRRARGVTTSAIDVDAARAAHRASTSPRSCSCAARTTRPGPSTRSRRSQAVLDAAPGLVIVDEAYGEFARDSALDLVDDDRALVVTRTYSKVWSLAALRLGYCVAPPWIVARARQGRAAVPPRREHAARRARPRCGSAPRWRHGSRSSSRTGSACSRRSTSSTASPCSRRARTSCCSGSTRPGRTWRDARPRGLAGPGGPGRARARLLALARRRGLPAGHGRHHGRERRPSCRLCVTSCASMVPS